MLFIISINSKYNWYENNIIFIYNGKKFLKIKKNEIENFGATKNVGRVRNLYHSYIHRTFSNFKIFFIILINSKYNWYEKNNIIIILSGKKFLK